LMLKSQNLLQKLWKAERREDQEFKLCLNLPNKNKLNIKFQKKSLLLRFKLRFNTNLIWTSHRNQLKKRLRPLLLLSQERLEEEHQVRYQNPFL
jgi:hypothetical protein